MTGAARPHREAGSGTVLGVGAMAVLTLALGAVVVLLSAMLAAGRAGAAADLSALAGASSLQQGASAAAACAAASDLAVRNAASLTGCWVTGDVVEVQCVSPLRVNVPGVPRQATAQARAGPDP